MAQLQLIGFFVAALVVWIVVRWNVHRKDNLARFGNRPLAFVEVRTLRGTTTANQEMVQVLPKLKSKTDARHAARSEGQGEAQVMFHSSYRNLTDREPTVSYYLGGDQEVMRLLEKAFDARGDGIEIIEVIDPLQPVIDALRAAEQPTPTEA